MAVYFTIKELCRSQYGIVYAKPYQLPLAYRLMKVLDIPREHFGFPFYVISGIRNAEVIRKMAQDEKCLNSSRYTDHSFLDPEVNLFGVGAIDFTCKKAANIKNIFYWILEKSLSSDFPVIGQLIWYPKRYFIHISNPKSLVFSTEAKELFNIHIPTKYLIYNEKKKIFERAERR